jgi:hypothetical protein
MWARFLRWSCLKGVIEISGANTQLHEFMDRLRGHVSREKYGPRHAVHKLSLSKPLPDERQLQESLYD